MRASTTPYADANERRIDNDTKEDNGEDVDASSSGNGDGHGDYDDSISSDEVTHGLDECHDERPNTRRYSYYPKLERRSIRPSYARGFSDVDGENRHSVVSTGSANSDKSFRYAKSGTNVVVLSEEKESSEEDMSVLEAREFDEQVLSKLTSLEESKLLLHRTRTVSSLASRLMAAPDEETCYEVASRLLVPLFCVDRCSYVFLKDSEHIIVKGMAVKKSGYAEEMGPDVRKYGGVVKPIKDSMVGLCAKTLQQQYCPRTKDSEFEVQRMMHTTGINTILVTPILVNRNNFTGAIVISMKEEDAFREYDRILIGDIAAMLGANIYAKQMRKAAENSNRISREMLHTMIPSKVIDKIKVFWDESSCEYHRRKSSLPSHNRNSTTSSMGDDSIGLDSSWNRKKSDLRRCDSTKAKLDFLNQVHSTDVSDGNTDAGFIVDTPKMEIVPTTSALYAENVDDVVIIFTDIVNFSRIAMEISPLDIIDMLHNLFSRFDALCEKHGVTKLETIGKSLPLSAALYVGHLCCFTQFGSRFLLVGDAYICTTNMFDEDKFGGNVKNAALSALNMAKDMVLATQDVIKPSKLVRRRNSALETLEIRVGIHVGEVTCGVLGERLPKFTVFGHNVNLAARMEQTCKPNKIRATEAFYSLVAGGEDEWDEFEVVSVKNMGSIGTYILDPLMEDGLFM
jgi:class 3 adenylate cyclase